MSRPVITNRTKFILGVIASGFIFIRLATGWLPAAWIAILLALIIIFSRTRRPV